MSLIEDLNNAYKLAKQAVDDLHRISLHAPTTHRQRCRDAVDGARMALSKLQDAIIMRAADPYVLVQAAFNLRQSARSAQLQIERIIEEEEELRAAAAFSFSPNNSGPFPSGAGGGGWFSCFKALPCATASGMGRTSTGGTSSQSQAFPNSATGSKGYNTLSKEAFNNVLLDHQLWDRAATSGVNVNGGYSYAGSERSIVESEQARMRHQRIQQMMNSNAMMDEHSHSQHSSSPTSSHSLQLQQHGLQQHNLMTASTSAPALQFGWSGESGSSGGGSADTGHHRSIPQNLSQLHQFQQGVDELPSAAEVAAQAAAALPSAGDSGGGMSVGLMSELHSSSNTRVRAAAAAAWQLQHQRQQNRVSGLRPLFPPGVMRASGKGRVDALCFVPGSGAQGGSRAQAEPAAKGEATPTRLLVVVGRRMLLYTSAVDNFYSDISIDGSEEASVMAAAHGPGGVLWTGHADGSLRAFPPHSSGLPCAVRHASGKGRGGAHSRVFAITALCTASSTGGKHQAVWVGDAAGRCMAVFYDPSSSMIRVLIKPRLVGSEPDDDLEASSNTSLQALQLSGGKSRPKEGGQESQPDMLDESYSIGSAVAPEHRVVHLLVKRGILCVATASHALHVLSTADASPIAACGYSRFGHCTAMSHTRWSSPAPPPPPPPAPTSERSMGGAQPPPPALNWRLLTGHSGGQCLVWDLSNSKVVALCAIGTQGGPAVKGLSVLHELGCMITAFENGCLSVGPIPNSSMSAIRSPPGRVPVWMLQQDVIQAHRSRITGFDTVGYCTVATASSAGGIKIWDASVLRSLATRKGIAFPLPPHTRLPVDPLASPLDPLVQADSGDSSGSVFSTSAAAAKAMRQGSSPSRLTASTAQALSSALQLLLPRPCADSVERSGSVFSTSAAAAMAMRQGSSPSSMRVQQLSGGQRRGHGSARPGNGSGSDTSSTAAAAAAYTPFAGGVTFPYKDSGELYDEDERSSLDGSGVAPGSCDYDTDGEQGHGPQASQGHLHQRASAGQAVAPLPAHPVPGTPGQVALPPIPQPQQATAGAVGAAMAVGAMAGQAMSTQQQQQQQPVTHHTHNQAVGGGGPAPNVVGAAPQHYSGGLSNGAAAGLGAVAGVATGAVATHALKSHGSNHQQQQAQAAQQQQSTVNQQEGQQRQQGAAPKGGLSVRGVSSGGESGKLGKEEPSLSDGFPGFRSADDDTQAAMQVAAHMAAANSAMVLANSAANQAPQSQTQQQQEQASRDAAVAARANVRYQSLGDRMPSYNFIQGDQLRLIDEIGRGAEGSVWRGRWHHIDVAIKEMHPRTTSFNKLAGAEGSVWRGRWHHIDVAVKEMHPRTTSFNRLAAIAVDLSKNERSCIMDSIMQEVQALVDVSQHPNIVRFIGVCVDPPRIVTEYYPLGSLFSIVAKAREGDSNVIRQMTWERRLQMLHNISAGMAYLHSRNYLHGDLRSPNIFVGLDGHVKIGDFGFARLLGDEASMLTSRTTNPRWLAPEVLRQGRSSRSADVFSLAIIMWEMLTWQIPYTGYFSVQVTFNHIKDNFRPDIPPDEQLPVSNQINLGPFKALMEECWHQDDQLRPSFSEVAARLSALMHWQNTNTVGRIRAQMNAATASKQQHDNPQARNSSQVAHGAYSPGRGGSAANAGPGLFNGGFESVAAAAAAADQYGHSPPQFQPPPTSAFEIGDDTPIMPRLAQPSTSITPAAAAWLSTVINAAQKTVLGPPSDDGGGDPSSQNNAQLGPRDHGSASTQQDSSGGGASVGSMDPCPPSGYPHMTNQHATTFPPTARRPERMSNAAAGDAEEGAAVMAAGSGGFNSGDGGGFGFSAFAAASQVALVALSDDANFDPNSFSAFAAANQVAMVALSDDANLSASSFPAPPAEDSAPHTGQGGSQGGAQDAVWDQDLSSYGKSQGSSPHSSDFVIKPQAGKQAEDGMGVMLPGLPMGHEGTLTNSPPGPPMGQQDGVGTSYVDIDDLDVDRVPSMGGPFAKMDVGLLGKIADD
eukprot:gene10698-12394_t